MKDFFMYTSQSSEAAIAFEGTECLVVLFSCALHGVLRLLQNDKVRLKKLAELNILETIDMLRQEKQELYAVWELDGVENMYDFIVKC